MAELATRQNGLGVKRRIQDDRYEVSAELLIDHSSRRREPARAVSGPERMQCAIAAQDDGESEVVELEARRGLGQLAVRSVMRLVVTLQPLGAKRGLENLPSLSLWINTRTRARGV